MDDARVVLVLNKQELWEDQTEKVAACVAEPASGQVKISYKSNPERAYLYRRERVRILAATATLNPAEVQLRIGGRLLSGVDAIIKFPGFYLVKKRGARALYEECDVREERDVAVDPSCGSALGYFRAVAELVSVKNEKGQSILAGQYKHLSRVPDASVLAAYLMPGSPLVESETPGPLIYPFGTNASQKVAVEKAFRSQVTIVQGPPGTGKTQTILNMVANAIHFGQTVAVVSNNNAATANVADKLKERGLGFLLASLGRRDNKTAFIEAQSGHPVSISGASRCTQEKAHLNERITSLLATADRLIRANNDRAQLAEQVARTRDEAALHRQIEHSTPRPEMDGSLTRWTARDLLNLLVECEELGPGTRVNLVGWVRSVVRHGLSGPKIRRQLLAAGPGALRSLYYDKYLAELEVQLAAVERILAESNFQSIQQQLEKLSWELLWASVAERFSAKDTRPIFTERDLWSKYAVFLENYPVVLSTTSLKTSLSPNCLYDLLIVDEASQVDVATGVLALSCAKRVVIVGDEKQLPNVIDDGSKQRADDVWNKYQPGCSAWNYARNSLLSSAAALWPQAPGVLLREHYRCHPKIAGFFNRKFYDGRLIAMTVDRGEPDVMKVVFTAPGNHARGRINQRQTDVIRQEVLPSLRGAGVTDIGIISPYRAQVAMLRDAVGEGVEVDTVHGFQGREKQAIIVSTVDNEIGDFIDDAKLLNVAVSRAKSKLIVVMAAGQDNFTTNFGDLVRYIRHHQQLVMHSQVRSVFDLLYANYEDARREFLNANGRSSVWDSENLAEAVIRAVLNGPEFAGLPLGCLRHVPLSWLVRETSGLSERERRFAAHPFSHVDLLVYDTIGKLPLVCVEVDGWAFHRPGSLQSERDETKDAIFRRRGLPLIRLSTTGSNEAAVISSAIRQAIGSA